MSPHVSIVCQLVDRSDDMPAWDGRGGEARAGRIWEHDTGRLKQLAAELLSLG
jgi:hypothetical protein